MKTIAVSHTSAKFTAFGDDFVMYPQGSGSSRFWNCGSGQQAACIYEAVAIEIAYCVEASGDNADHIDADWVRERYTVLYV